MSATKLRNTVLFNNANLKALYEFESGALTTDSSGQGKTLTNNNAVGEGTGVYGVCADFGSTNSTKSFNRTPDILSHAEIAAGWTFNMWIKTADITAANELFRYISNDGTYERNLESYINTNGSIEIIVYDGTSKKLTTAASIVSINNFYLVSFTYDGTTLRTYLNGAMVASSGLSWSNYARTAYSNFSIGAEQLNNGDGVSDLFKGLIDDFSVFNVALSADQIKELYEGRFLGELRPNQFGTTAGLYHLSNETDFSGNNYHLTNNNTVAFSSGRFGNCADFGTSNTNKSLSVSNPLGINGGNMSASLWIKARTEIGSGAYGLFMQGNNSSQTGYGINYEYNGGTRRLGFFRTKFAVAKEQASYNITLGTSDWYHLALTYDTTNIRGYVNGALVVTQTASGSGGGTFLNGLTIGAENTSSYASVFVDELMLSSTALTANQIRTMYALGKGLYY